MRYPVVKKTVYSDMMFAKKTKSLRQHTCTQIFTDSIGSTHAYPTKKKSEADDLQMIPETIVTDGAAEETGLTGSGLSISTKFRPSAPSHTHHGRIERNARFGSWRRQLGGFYTQARRLQGLGA
jgi:hypothetical protein